MQDKKRFEDQIVIYVTGEDRPGIMADFLRIFDHPSCKIVDIDQMVVYKKLFMAITIRYLSDETGAHRDILKEVLYRAKQIGVRVDFDIDKSSSFEGEKSA